MCSILSSGSLIDLLSGPVAILCSCMTTQWRKLALDDKWDTFRAIDGSRGYKVEDNLENDPADEQIIEYPKECHFSYELLIVW